MLRCEREPKGPCSSDLPETLTVNLKPLARLAIALAIAVTATTLPLAGAVQAAPSSRTAVTAPYKNLPGGTKRSKSLVIGVDGAAFDVLAKTDLPRLKSLMAGGMTATSNLYANPYAPTVSGPGWSTIATGVWPDKHNVKDNNFTDPAFGTYPDYATRLETADPAISTLVVGTWSPIPTIIFGEKTDLRLEGGDDAGTTAKAVDYLRNGNPDSTFVHLDEVDGAATTPEARAPSTPRHSGKPTTRSANCSTPWPPVRATRTRTGSSRSPPTTDTPPPAATEATPRWNGRPSSSPRAPESLPVRYATT